MRTDRASSTSSPSTAAALAFVAVLVLAPSARALPAPEPTPEPTPRPAGLVLDLLEPATLAAYAPAVLALRGSGFAAGAQVFIETAAGARFLAYQPRALSSDRCEVDLRLGFGPLPAERRIFVRNPDGTESQSLRLRIAPALATPAPLSTGAAPTATPGEPPAAPVPVTASAAAPTIRELRPSALPAGQPVELEILGSGFASGARVELTVNLHAGSSRMPEYGARLFAADWLDESELSVAFDRGFHPTPGVRNLVVVNPDGQRSGAALVRILAVKEEL